MVGLLIYLALSTFVIVSYMTHNFNVKQIKDSIKETEEQSAYFYDFVKNHYNAYISIGVPIPSNVGIIDLINANVLPKNFPRDLPFQAVVKRNSCNPNIYDVVYLTNNTMDLRDYLMRHDWSFAKDIVDPCRPNESGLKIDYAKNGIGTVYGYNIGNNYTGNIIILTAPKQVGYLIFKLGWRDAYPFYLHPERYSATSFDASCVVSFQPFVKFEGFSTICPSMGINMENQNSYIKFEGARAVSEVYSDYYSNTSTICIPALKSDYKYDVINIATSMSQLHQPSLNQLNIDFTDIADYFVYDILHRYNVRCSNLTPIPFIARSFATIIKSSLTNRYYLIFLGATYSQTGNWNKTREGYPVFEFDSNLGQIAHASLIKLAASFAEGETEYFETTSNSYPNNLGANKPVPDDMIHRIIFNKNHVYWYIGYYDKDGNKKEGIHGKLATVPFGRNY